MLSREQVRPQTEVERREYQTRSEHCYDDSKASSIASNSDGGLFLLRVIDGMSRTRLCWHLRLNCPPQRPCPLIESSVDPYYGSECIHLKISREILGEMLE